MIAEDYAPVALFLYNRPEHTRRTLEALARNTLAARSTVYVFSDGPKPGEDPANVGDVRALAHQMTGFRDVQIEERATNAGLAHSVIYGVTKVLSRHGRIVVLEDDLVTHPAFLQFMNDALTEYGTDPRIFAVTGFSYAPGPLVIPEDYRPDVFLSPRAHSWTWGTWKDRWDRFDSQVSGYREFVRDRRAIETFNRGGDDLSGMLALQMEGKIDSWAIRWCYTLFRYGGYCVYPVRSLVNNIGNDGTGVHHDRSGRFAVMWREGEPRTVRPSPGLLPDAEILRRFRAVFAGKRPTAAQLVANAVRLFAVKVKRRGMSLIGGENR